MNGYFEFDDEAWENISEEAKDLLSKIFVPESKRITPKKVLDHPWVSKYAEDKSVCSQFTHKLQGICGYQKKSKFRKIVLSYLATRVSDEDIERERKIFKLIDKNGDGYITKKEFKKMCAQHKLNYDVEEAFESMDLDHNGAINYNEFLAATMDRKAAMDPNKIKNAFKFFDLDNDGMISKQDFKKLLKNDENLSVDGTVIDEVINECDENEDGQISFRGFYRCMSLNSARRSTR